MDNFKEIYVVFEYDRNICRDYIDGAYSLKHYAELHIVNRINKENKLRKEDFTIRKYTLAE